MVGETRATSCGRGSRLRVPRRTVLNAAAVLVRGGRLHLLRMSGIDAGARRGPGPRRARLVMVVERYMPPAEVTAPPCSRWGTAAAARHTSVGRLVRAHDREVGHHAR